MVDNHPLTSCLTNRASGPAAAESRQKKSIFKPYRARYWNWGPIFEILREWGLKFEVTPLQHFNFGISCLVTIRLFTGVFKLVVSGWISSLINHINLIMQPYHLVWRKGCWNRQTSSKTVKCPLPNAEFPPWKYYSYKADTMSTNTKRFLVKDQQHLMDNSFFMEEFNSSDKMNIRNDFLNRRWASEK